MTATSNRLFVGLALRQGHGESLKKFFLSLKLTRHVPVYCVRISLHVPLIGNCILKVVFVLVLLNKLMHGLCSAERLE